MNNKTKAYMDLYLKIRNDIIRGIYQTGDKLPSKRILADKENVSVITVAHAYELLASEGYITSRMRSGYYVSYLEKDFLVLKKIVVSKSHRKYRLQMINCFLPMYLRWLHVKY